MIILQYVIYMKRYHLSSLL